MPIATKITESMRHSSWIRKMFDAGIVLKKRYGADRVFDFSLGNPDVPSPAAFDQALVTEAQKTGAHRHGYMPNKGYTETCTAIAEVLEKESGLPFTAEQVLMTCGTAGAINVIFKTLLDPGDEVMVIAPYFTEYDFYIDNHQGRKVMVQTTADLLPDLDDLAAKITTRTKILVINSPNNPTGRIYSAHLLTEIGKLLTRSNQTRQSPIYLLTDEPYKKIVFDGKRCDTAFRFYRHTIMATSFSKDLSLAGERIGYLAVSPLIEDNATIIAAAAFCNRVLGFINAPALMQRVISHVLNERVDVALYQRRRDLIYNGLVEIGYEVIKPEGAFYIFPKSPIPDDVVFINALQENLILATPGVAFHRPGYFRISFAVPEREIIGALPGFAKVFKQFK